LDRRNYSSNPDRTPSPTQVQYRGESDRNRAGNTNLGTERERNPINTSRRESNDLQHSPNDSDDARVSHHREHSVDRRGSHDRTDSEGEERRENHHRHHHRRGRHSRRSRREDREDTRSRERGRNETHKIPRVLCDKFGDKRTRDFKTFEREFSAMCRLYSVPETQKLERMVLHLEGSVQVHANSWIDAQEEQEYTYRDLVAELKRSFQKSVRADEAELKLVGRKWNIFESTIEEFVHDTRVLVQQAYPDEPKRWDNWIKTSIRLALPDTLVRVVSTLGS
ncbi:MAG: hypothetical protein GY820_10925, partial [Gammaproteobacteria bacterium]|nr:hypothetical protein [Gammaproteobacteria bacterium]